ncbi:hypothetical protein T02_15783 [Trichinella nativa]|uniref:Uncharacterized protein n=1 Tax=Trichinella nativa TaxID=6335 RepID=A0A0V1KM48_9BILA|nr:hypothetical protein T02_15783 [Trichinella nativa]
MDYTINIELIWLNGVTQYCSRNLCGFAYRIFVEYYVNRSVIPIVDDIALLGAVEGWKGAVGKY